MADKNNETPRLSNEKQNFDQVEKPDEYSISNDQRQIDDDPVEARRIVRKVDWRVSLIFSDSQICTDDNS